MNISRFMASLLLGLGAVYLVIMLLMFVFQKHLVFHPSQNIHSTPGDLGQAYENVEIETEDGIQIHGWFMPAENDERTIILFHGNAGNIADRVYFLNDLKELGLNIFIFDYRGFGRSEGSPDEEGLYADGRAAWDYLIEKKGMDPEKIILFGRSLGSAVATKLAVEKKAGALLLDAPFISGPDLGADIYPWLPVRMLMKYEFSNAKRIQNIAIPVLIAHSPADRVIPYSHGRKLFEIANEPKKFVELDGHHGAGFDERGYYFESIQHFIDQYVPPKAEE